MGKSGGVGFSHGYDLNLNELRLDIEEKAGITGLDAIANSVGTYDGRTAGLFVGDLVAAHRAAVDLARKVYITDAPSEVDIGIFKAFPEEAELCQSRKALEEGIWIEKNH